MLVGNQSISHYSPSNVMIWLIMSFQAGLLNIGGLLAGHQYVSHITGFASSFGVAISNGNLSLALRVAGVPIVFMIGAMVSGYFVDVRIKLNKAPKYYITFGIMFILTLIVFIGGVAGLLGAFGHESDETSYLLLIMLCFICGIQNGTISTVSKSVVRTTHLTGITTDLGLSLVRLFNRTAIEINEFEEKRASLMRIGLIVFFILGSALGGIIFSKIGFWGFSVPMLIAGSLFFMMYYFQIKKKE